MSGNNVVYFVVALILLSSTVASAKGLPLKNLTSRADKNPVVDGNIHNVDLKPATNQTCNTETCSLQWVEKPWGPCSTQCGEDGNQSRVVQCQKNTTNGIPSVVKDEECSKQLGPKPETLRECNGKDACPTWFIADWRPCNKMCGEGKQTRQVICHQRVGSQVEVLPDEECGEEKPPPERDCFVNFCEGVDWVTSEWTECATCQAKVRTRTAKCVIKTGQVVNDTFCAHHKLPVLEEPCDPVTLPNCTAQWHATQWSNCSVECGEGIKSRRVFCGQFNGGGVMKVEDDLCDPNAKDNETTPCEIPQERCPAKWFAGPWSECSVECGKGNKSRHVFCGKLNRGEVMNLEDDLCDPNTKVNATTPCEIPPEECPAKWFTGPWSECSVECGKGNKSRRVFCGKIDSTMKVEDNFCDPNTRGKDTTPCEIPPEKCPAKWFAGPWSECDKPCDGGQQHRQVICYKGDEESECDSSLATNSSQACNTGPCSKGEEASLTNQVEELIKNKTTTIKKKKAPCHKTKFGCCPDNTTAAAGPFDKDCNSLKPCSESKFDCCPDGVSPANGPNYDGCVIPPCNKTLFGCCLSDNETAAEGNNQEGCPAPPPYCKSSQFGCCSDGVTKAKGMLGEGCVTTEINKATSVSVKTSKQGYSTTKTVITDSSTTIKETEPTTGSPYSSAELNQTEATSCSTSTYGCCPDGESPAHGPDEEGCCLNSTYGCCPDNYEQAEGPNHEGCGCQYARYGCCPDNETMARGPNKEGCGCQYTQYACCPDRYTEALGPEFEGCGCHTYQFGCCPDGVLHATGPNAQGCSCEETRYGCCGDNQTVAGPNMLECDCASSEYGCCLDGKTEAQGENFLRCPVAPGDKQAMCALPVDYGSCNNYTAQWYFEPKFGVCREFFYAGCEGNGNRFPTKEECIDVCINPPSRDVCKLPKLEGSGSGIYRRWYYDSGNKQCEQFIYVGGVKNANNFESKDECRQLCVPPKEEDQCKLPIEVGPCAGNFRRWGFNKESRKCELFLWGGCEGNINRFSSEAACDRSCNPPGIQKAECLLPQDIGNCTEKQAMWSFSQKDNRCVPFYYTGCGGNDNRFDSELSCRDSCPSSFEPDVCTLPVQVSKCSNWTLMWYYDTSKQRCGKYYEGDCGGNGNSFETLEECEGRCSPSSLSAVVKTTPRQEELTPDICQFPKSSGPCNDLKTKWYFDKTKNTCSKFTYSGCDGNHNRFNTEEECKRRCKSGPAQSKPFTAAPNTTRSTPTPTTTTLSTPTPTETKQTDPKPTTTTQTTPKLTTTTQTTPKPTTTKKSTPKPTTKTRSTPAPTKVYVPQRCRISSSLEPCKEAEVVWYLDSFLQECTAFKNAAEGKHCRRSGVFPTKEKCEQACTKLPDLVTHLNVTEPDICSLPSLAGPCKKYAPRWYFDVAKQICRPFYYGGCGGNANNFKTKNECQDRCTTVRPIVVRSP